MRDPESKGDFMARSCVLIADSRALRAFLFITVVGCGGAHFYDISPNAPVGSSSAGLTYAIAGNDDALYAVSLDAGVWRSPASSATRTWTQLPGPRYAMSVAVDPADPKHLAVGERNGDAKEIRLNEAGLWESFDTGQTWTYSLNPMVLPSPFTGTAPCLSQVAPSVVFTSKSTIVAATACGIARKSKGATAFVPATIPASTGFISAVVASETKVWARTPAGQLLVSVDDGATFTAATTKPLPDGVGFAVRGDPVSLAASDRVVIMSGCCETGGPPPQSGHFANEIVIYRVNGDTWSVLPITIGTTITAEGQYVGGRRFVRSFNTGHGDAMFFFSNAQALWAFDFSSDATLIGATGVDINPPTFFRWAGSIHRDVWDVNYDPKTKVLWLATDGGVYENRGAGWNAIASGLHTQHVQTLDVEEASDGTHVSYATQDNDAWFGSDRTTWSTTGALGDTNWSDADTGNPHYAFFGRNLTAYSLQGLDTTATTQNGAGALVANGQSPLPLFLQFIQSTSTETDVPLDALLIVTRPVLDASGNALTPPAALAGIQNTGGPWLLRNRSWASNPGFYAGLANWTVELNDLPVGTERVYVSGGHAHPTYFALVRQSGTLVLMQHVFVRRRGAGFKWQPIFSGVMDWTSACGAPRSPSDIPGWYGPVFVNPYDPTKIFLLAPDGVKVSHADITGALVFADDTVLTALITASGTYDLVRETCGGNILADPVTQMTVPIASRTLGTGTLSLVSFSRDNPAQTIATSPFTGVFFDSGDGIWRSFSNILPKPFTPTYAARVAKLDAFIGFAGRSIGRVANPGDAARATYFKIESQFFPALGGGSQEIARLVASDGSNASNEDVSIRIMAADGTTIYDEPVVNLDNQGRVRVPVVKAVTGSVVHIHFAGDESAHLAASEIHFAR